jgi:hypothetical protein
MKTKDMVKTWVNYAAYCQSKGTDLLDEIARTRLTGSYGILFGEDDIKINYKTKKIRFKPDTQWIDMDERLLNVPKSLIQWGALVFKHDEDRTDENGLEEASIEVVIGTGNPFSYIVDGKENGLPVVNGTIIAAPAVVYTG